MKVNMSEPINKQAEADLLKPCPDCGGLIRPQAEDCRYCHSVEPFKKARRKEKIINMLVTIVLAISLAVTVFYISVS